MRGVERVELGVGVAELPQDFASVFAEIGRRATHGIRLAAQVIDAVYNAAGATAAYESSLIQRHFQDIHVITQHLQSRLSHYELVGSHWLGLPVDENRL